ncbi:transporter [Acinetobacter bereziniae]|nr:transporter [Acinetobacter bereziniae]
MKENFFLIVFFILCVSCSSENKGDAQLEAHSVNKNNINDPCFNSDCTPEKFNSPYYKIPYEKLKDLEFLNYENFGTVLLSKDVLSSEILKGYSFKDKDNSNYIDLENQAMLTINPNPSTGKVKSIDCEFLTCSSIQLIDKDRIKKL